MPEPDEIQLACIGCGTMNPADAEVCTGCGHRFAGPKGGRIAGSLPVMAPAPEELLRIEDRSSPPTSKSTTFLGCLGTTMGILLATVAAIIAFVVAFFVTCTSIGGNDSSGLIWSSLAGLGAVAIVVAVAIWIGSMLRGHPR